VDQEETTDAMKGLNFFLSEQKSFKISDGAFLIKKTGTLASS
jgi:hypothetical protein